MPMIVYLNISLDKYEIFEILYKDKGFDIDLDIDETYGIGYITMSFDDFIKDALKTYSLSHEDIFEVLPLKLKIILDKIAFVKKRSCIELKNDSKYVKMLNRKYEIYRGKILKSLKEVVSQIGVNHIVKEDTLKYGKEYDKGFKRVISIYI